MDQKLSSSKVEFEGLRNTKSHNLRRHYPKEYDGAKNHWKALIDHQQEADKNSRNKLHNHQQSMKKLQGENLLCQMRYKNDKKKMTKDYEIAGELAIVEADNKRAQYEYCENKKLSKMQAMLLRETNKQLAQHRSKSREEKNHNSNRESMNNLEGIMNNQDLNLVRKINSEAIAKENLLANMKMANYRDHYDSKNEQNTRVDNDHDINGQGNFLEPIYHNQKNWRNFYNHSADDQQNKVKNFQIYMQKEQESKNPKRSKLATPMMHSFGDNSQQALINPMKLNSSMDDDVIVHQNQKNYLEHVYNKPTRTKESATIRMPQLNSNRYGYKKPHYFSQNHLERRDSIHDIKKDENDKVRKIIQEQLNIKNVDKMNRHKMPMEDKYLNYNDLQAWKEHDNNQKNNTLPRHGVDNKYANAIIGKFNKVNDIYPIPDTLDDYLFNKDNNDANVERGSWHPNQLPSRQSSHHRYRALSKSPEVDSRDFEAKREKHIYSARDGPAVNDYNKDMNLSNLNDRSIHHKLYKHYLVGGKEEVQDPAHRRYLEQFPVAYNQFTKKKMFDTPNTSSNMTRIFDQCANRYHQEPVILRNASRENSRLGIGSPGTRNEAVPDHPTYLLKPGYQLDKSKIR